MEMPLCLVWLETTSVPEFCDASPSEVLVISPCICEGGAELVVLDDSVFLAQFPLEELSSIAVSEDASVPPEESVNNPCV